jgi:peptide subunit release factor 1 (eRF1)
MTRPAAGGGRWVDVPPARLARWIDNFRTRHGEVASTVDDGVLLLRAVDGSEAECHPAPGARTTSDLDAFVEAAAEPRRIGLVLARKAAVAVGVADGDELVTHKVDTAYVQSRTAAGGWSQQRFARRRVNQAKAAAGDASDLVLRLIVPEASRLTAVVTGGDRKTVESIMADPRLAKLTPLVADRLLNVAEPRLVVLQEAVEAARSVRIKVT